MITRVTSYGRAGLLGNPSDGYFGKTIALGLLDFPAQVTIYESPEIRIEHNREDNSEFADLDSMVREIERFGYYGGVRLVKATIRQFVKYCLVIVRCFHQQASTNQRLGYSEEITSQFLALSASMPELLIACKIKFLDEVVKASRIRKKKKFHNLFNRV